MKALLALLVCGCGLGADTLGFVELKFSDLHFGKGQWSRKMQLPCYSYSAETDGATVEVLRAGMGNLVPFKGRKGLTVTVCGSVATFDEGFEAGNPASKLGDK